MKIKEHADKVRNILANKARNIIRHWLIIAVALMLIMLLIYSQSIEEASIILNNKITGYTLGYVRQAVPQEQKAKVCPTIEPLICEGDKLFSQRLTPECDVSKRLVQTCDGGCVDGECVKSLVGQAARVLQLDKEELQRCNNDTVCDQFENYEVCPNDCSSGSQDWLCDGQEDKICDPDCVNKNDDMDCMSFWRKVLIAIKKWLFEAPVE